MLQKAKAKRDESAKRSRPLGLVENIYRTAGKLGAWVLTRAVLLEGYLDEATLRIAMIDAQHRFDALRSRIVTPRVGRPRFETSENDWEVPLRVVERDSDEHWRRVCDEESHIPFANDAPVLWRVSLVQSRKPGRFELIIMMHHALADGFTLNTLVEFLLTRCSEILLKMAKPVQESQPLLPALDRLLPGGVISRTTQFLKAQIRSAFAPSVKLLSSEEVNSRISPDQRRSLPVTRSFDGDFTKRLRARCRHEGTTVFGAFNAAIWAATWLFAGSGVQRLSNRTPINLRERCQPAVPKDQIGCYVWYVDTHHEVAGTSRFWSLARACRQETQEAMASYGMPPTASMRIPVEAAIRGTILGNKLGRMTTTCVSNLGGVNIPCEYGRFRVREMYSMSAQHLIGSTVAAWLAGLDKRIFATFFFVMPLFHRERAETYVDTVEYLLMHSVKSEDFRLNRVLARESKMTV